MVDHLEDHGPLDDALRVLELSALTCDRAWTDLDAGVTVELVR